MFLAFKKSYSWCDEKLFVQVMRHPTKYSGLSIPQPLSESGTMDEAEKRFVWHPRKYLGLSIQTPWPAKPTWNLPNGINDRGGKAGCASGGDIHPTTLIFSAGQLAKRVAIPTFFLDAVSEQVARPNRKKKKRSYDGNVGKGVFGVSGVFVLIISFSLVAALPCGHISLYVHRMAMCTKKIQWTLWAFTSFAFNGNPVDSLVSDPTNQSTVDTEDSCITVS